MMSTLIRIIATMFVIGFTLVFAAAVAQCYSQSLADAIGYSGLGFMTFGGVVGAIAICIKIWSKNDHLPDPR